MALVIRLGFPADQTPQDAKMPDNRRIRWKAHSEWSHGGFGHWQSKPWKLGLQNDSRRRDFSQRLPVSLGPIWQLSRRGARQRTLGLSVDGPESFRRSVSKPRRRIPKGIALSVPSKFSTGLHGSIGPQFTFASASCGPRRSFGFILPSDLRRQVVSVRDGLSERPRPHLADQAGFVSRA